MPSFRELLDDTLVVQAGSVDALIANIPEPPVIPAQPPNDLGAEFAKIWHFAHDSARPGVVTDLTCVSRGIGNVRMKVCDRITFDDVRVVLENQRTLAIPLDEKFIVMRSFLNSGGVATGRSPLFPLEARLDLSMLVAFALEFDKGLDSAARKPADDVLQSSSFMPAPGGDVGGARTVTGGQTLTATVGPLRVLVFLQLVLGKERPDFDPGGALGVARVMPHLMIMANRPLLETHARLEIARPAKMTIVEGKAPPHFEHHMNSTIENALFEDSNGFVPIAPLAPVPSPIWDDLFEAYLLGQSSVLVPAVRPDKPARSVVGAVEKLNNSARLPFPAGQHKPYVAAPLARLERQGGFDNIHVAPTMKSAAKTDPATAATLDKIYMAPICEHDCLHTHWRWGAKISAASNFGWSSPPKTPAKFPGTPLKVAGAPMVPDNQRVSLEVLSLSSFRYEVDAIGYSAHEPKRPIAAGTYTIVFHHGSGYAVSVSAAKVTAASTLVDAHVAVCQEPVVDPASGDDTSTLYWHLRFGGTRASDGTNVAQERIRITDLSKLLTG